MKYQLAFYRSDHSNSRLIDKVISYATGSVYSHVELVFDTTWGGKGGYCFSSSPRDGGVRCKLIDFVPERWDLIPFNPIVDQDLNTFIDQHEGKPYDWFGAIGVAVPFFQGTKNRWFCSEIVAEFIGLHNPSSLSPGELYLWVSSRN